MAERQENVISVEQLLDAGFSRNQIRDATGEWMHPVYRGVRVLGTRLLTPRGRVMAALLASGERVVASHRTAAAIHGIVRAFPSVPELTTDRARRARNGIVLHRRALPRHEVTRSRQILLTTVDRTILDLAAERPQREVEVATSEAEYLNLWDPFSLPQFLESHKGWDGVALLRRMLAEGAITITKSELERRFRAFLRRRRLPLPETNVPMRLDGRRIVPDCVWRERRLIVELDGRAAHRTTSRFHGDRLRDRKLDLLGWTVWRVTARHLDDALERDLRKKLGCAR